MLKIRGLEKKLQEQLVLHDLDMDVEDGCIYGLIGPNGAGKSTLLRVIAGVYEPDQGTLYIDDHNMQENLSCFSDILLISDEPYYFHNATLCDMKHFFKIAHPHLDEEYYHHLVKLFDLNDQQPLHKYSKGMKRQAFLILGLCSTPRYLLLDEAFDGLDPHMRMLFKKEIVNRLEEKEMSVIISSHNLKEMEEICDRFGILEQGKLITSGNMSERLSLVHRFQLAFKEHVNEGMFDALSLLSISIDSRIVNLVAEGELQELQEALQRLHPLMMETLPVSLEEVFVYVMKQREEERHGDQELVETVVSE